MFRRRKSPADSSPTLGGVGEESRHLSAWDTGLVFLSNGRCPYLKEFTVYIPESLEKLAKEGRSSITTEFMLYAKSVELGNKIIVLPYYCVPRQKASATFVEALDDSCNSYDVVVHKHPDGVKHFSATDDESINANNKVSILLESGEIADVVLKQKLPCGAYAVTKPSVKTYLPITIGDSEVEVNDADVNSIVKEIREKIVEDKPTSYYPTSYYPTYPTYNDDDKNTTPLDDDWDDWENEPV